MQWYFNPLIVPSQTVVTSGSTSAFNRIVPARVEAIATIMIEISFFFIICKCFDFIAKVEIRQASDKERVLQV